MMEEELLRLREPFTTKTNDPPTGAESFKVCPRVMLMELNLRTFVPVVPVIVLVVSPLNQLSLMAVRDLVAFKLKAAFAASAASARG